MREAARLWRLHTGRGWSRGHRGVDDKCRQADTRRVAGRRRGAGLGKPIPTRFLGPFSARPREYMVKARLSEPSLASHGKAARSTRLHAVSPEELARILAAHRLYIQSGRKRGTRANLSAAELAGHDLSGMLLRRIKLDHALLRNANLAAADLQQANLIGADLRGARLAGADLGAARISGANLQAADIEEAVLVGADLEFAMMARAVLRRARLRGADMSGVNLDGADLREADLREVNLRGASLRQARLDHADLRAARLGGAFLNGASLRAADLRGAYLRVARLDGADLSAADLRNAEGLVSAQLGSALCLTDARLPADLSAGE